MKERMKLRLYLVLLIVSVFSVVIAGYTVIYLKTPYVYFYSSFVFVIVLLLIGNYVVRPLIEKMGEKKTLLAIAGVTIISIAFTQSAIFLTSPKWVFTITTDKPTYRLGEEVQIIVALENQGFITHSFESVLSNPIIVTIEYEHHNWATQVWYSPFHEDPTIFSIQPKQSLERAYLWNQTNRNSPEKEIQNGTYQIWAFIPSIDSWHPSHNPLFWTWTKINITSNLHNPSLP